MINLEILTTFFGWCSVINFAILIITTLLLGRQAAATRIGPLM